MIWSRCKPCRDLSAEECNMIERCRNAGLLEPEFYLTGGFVTIIRRKPEQALKAVTPQVGTK